MNINLKVIPHSEQLYDSVGDYWLDEEGIWQVRVSKMSDWRHELLVGFHEISELAITQWHMIKEEDIRAFDIMYEEERQKGLHTREDEPGNDPRAPYRQAHSLATALERILSYALGVNWSIYDEDCMSLQISS